MVDIVKQTLKTTEVMRCKVCELTQLVFYTRLLARVSHDIARERGAPDVRLCARPHKSHNQAVADEGTELLSSVVVRRYKGGGAHGRNVESIAEYSQRDRATREPYCIDSVETKNVGKLGDEYMATRERIHLLIPRA
jgi:hypothetical protein